MMSPDISAVTPIQKKESKSDKGVLDASKNNRAPSLSSEKLFEIKYGECYGNYYDLDELKNLAIFDILAYSILTTKQLNDIQKNMESLKKLSFEEIDSKRNEAIMKNKKYTEPEYKLVSYYFLKNNKLNVVYEHKNENDAFIMMLKNNNIEDTIQLYYDKIAKFRENNSFTPRDWTIRISTLKQILKKINKNKF